ncbi:unnamed protein product [Nezara viridula]|uniref:mRNA export factor GLE1 n=2 Tax=Nezara viridula TaxID=85310 RepID=A0A9P0HMU9_NEZVI|nr:unnamed protein product [Nezara viridula]
MDKHSIPMAFLLNDGDIDKTGYQQLKVKSFMKAANCFPISHGISIGPNAVENTKWDSFTPSKIEEIENLYHSMEPITNNSTLLKQTTNFDDTEPNVRMNESSEKREDRLCRRRILAELENICYLESQERINQMRKEWLEREEMVNAQIESELEAEKLVREEKRKLELNTIQAKISQFHKYNRANSALIKKLTEDEGAIRAKELQLENEMKNLETKRMLKELDKIYHNEVEYREKYGEIAQIITTFSDNKFQNSISAEKDIVKTTNNEFLELIQKCKENDITPELVVKSYSLLSSIKKVHGSIMTKHDYFKKELENEAKRVQQELELREQKQKEEEEEKKNQLEAKKKEEDEKKKIQAAEETDGEINRLKATLQHYLKYASLFDKVKESLQAFMSDTSLKKFRSECQKAVNISVNAISPTSAAHMNDKLKKLTSILSGQQIMVNGKLFIPNQHPMGVQYCTYFLAQKIVKQGEDVVSSKPDAAFAIASVALAIWGDFPDFGNLLVAAFYEACPYLIPIYWDKEEGMSDVEYYKKLGFRYVDDERDEINVFLKKQGGIARLYFALMVAHMKSRSVHEHPWGAWQAWRWIAMFTSLNPEAEISATILLTMLEICGFTLMKAYGKQFKKLLHLICVHYVPEVEKVTPPGRGGPVTRLKSFLENMIGNARSLQPPKGLLQPNFW